MVATWYGDDSPRLSWNARRYTVKAGENGQYSGEMDGSSPWTPPVAPGCGDTPKAFASSCLISGGDQDNLAPGSLSTGSPAGRTPLVLRGGGSMYSQAFVRAR